MAEQARSRIRKTGLLPDVVDDIERALAERLPPGQLLADVAFAASETRTLQHKLGVRPRGVIASLPRGAAISLLEVERTDTAVKLTNTTASAGAVDLWVYR